MATRGTDSREKSRAVSAHGESVAQSYSIFAIRYAFALRKCTRHGKNGGLSRHNCAEASSRGSISISSSRTGQRGNARAEIETSMVKGKERAVGGKNPVPITGDRMT